MDRKQLLKMKAVRLGSIASNPKNPREDFQDQSLVESIKNNGLKDPIDLRPIHKTDSFPDDIHFVICDGDRRDDALKEIYPADHMLTVGKEFIIHDLTPEEAYDFNVIKNMEREDYNLREECNVVQHYKEQGLSQTKIAKKCNRSRRWVSDRIRLLEADIETQTEIFSGNLDLTSLRPQSGAMAQLEDEPSKTPLLDKYRPENDVAPEDGAMQSITKPPKFLCPTQFFDDLQEAFPHEKFIDVKMVGAFTGFSIASANENTVTRITNLVKNLTQETEHKKSKPSKKQGPEEKRTTLLTKEQFTAIAGQLDYDDEVQSYQPIGDHVHILWREPNLHYNAIQWLLNNKDKLPLDEHQLKLYTDLKPSEIEEVLEVEEDEPIREVGDSEPCFIDVSQKEYDSFTEEIKYLISKEEKQKGGSRRVWFRTWVDNQRAFNWLKPSQEWDLGLLDFPAKTFKNTNLQDVFVDVKKSFPVLYQELRNLQKLTKKISPISNTTIMEIISTTGNLRVPHNNFVDQLLLIKRRRRIDAGREQHKKICDKCLQPKWMGPQQILCGNCEYQERQQKKNSAAATSSGGRA